MRLFLALLVALITSGAGASPRPFPRCPKKLALSPDLAEAIERAEQNQRNGRLSWRDIHDFPMPRPPKRARQQALLPRLETPISALQYYVHNGQFTAEPFAEHAVGVFEGREVRTRRDLEDWWAYLNFADGPTARRLYRVYLTVPVEEIKTWLPVAFSHAKAFRGRTLEFRLLPDQAREHADRFVLGFETREGALPFAEAMAAKAAERKIVGDRLALTNRFGAPGSPVFLDRDVEVGGTVSSWRRYVAHAILDGMLRCGRPVDLECMTYHLIEQQIDPVRWTSLAPE